MRKEAPLLSQALKLVSFALIIALVAIVISAGFSAYQEFDALKGLSTTQAPQSSSGQLNFSMTGNSMALSGLNIPNRMVYPLKLELIGNVSLANTTIGKFDSGAQTIDPGSSTPISVTMNLNFTKLTTNSETFQELLFNSSTLGISTTIATNIVPLLGINLTRTANSTIGPVISNFHASLETSNASLSPDGQYALVPLVLSWDDQTPITFTGMKLNATIVSGPGMLSGNYGTASGQFNLTPGSDGANYTMRVPLSELSQGSFSHGNYTILFALESGNATVRISRTVSM